MLYDFIQIVTTGNLGKLTPKEWENIYSEYCEMSSTSTMNATLELAIEINYLTSRINIAQSIVYRLYLREKPELIQILKDMGFFFSFTDVKADLRRVTMQLKGDEMRLNKAVGAYKELTKDEGKKATEFDWYEMLSELGKFQTYAVNPKTTSVTEYCALEKRFQRHIEHLKNQAARYGQ